MVCVVRDACSHLSCVRDREGPRYSLLVLVVAREVAIQFFFQQCSGGLPSPAKLVTAEVKISLVSYM